MCKILGRGDTNVIIYHPQCDLSNLKLIVIGGFTSIFSMFERQLQMGTALCTNGSSHSVEEA